MTGQRYFVLGMLCNREFFCLFCFSAAKVVLSSAVFFSGILHFSLCATWCFFCCQILRSSERSLKNKFWRKKTLAVTACNKISSVSRVSWCYVRPENPTPDTSDTCLIHPGHREPPPKKNNQHTLADEYAPYRDLLVCCFILFRSHCLRPESWHVPLSRALKHFFFFSAGGILMFRSIDVYSSMPLCLFLFLLC